jgi:SAM-dependent methyltransferase
MQSDQELFAKGLATYRKVITANYMYHREVYTLLHQIVLDEGREGFVFVDIACGTAPLSAEALAGTGVGHYIGLDISQPSLDVAREALAGLPCPVDLRCQDFVEAINAWDGPLDIAWIGQSLHHLRAPEKRTFMHKIAGLLPPHGLFMIWEATCLDGEDREGWMERFRQIRPQWPGITDEEFAAFDSHHRASDFAETSAAWLAMGHEAGFERAEELMTAPNELARVYRFQH